MKITINVDCTPLEARSFLGLPNVEPMQDAMIERMHGRLSSYLDSMEPEAIMNLWFPGGMKGLGQLQEQFWRQFMAGMAQSPAGNTKRES
jgi:hypothetical protein